MAIYDARFFADISDGSYRSALAILPLLLNVTGARSIVDVGCGDGAWLAAASELGVPELLGLDGSYVLPERLRVPSELFRAVDLAKTLTLDETFDLVLSFEVAEHLAPKRGESFVRDLAGLGPVVAFSAAIPGQGGREHVNERWPDYWHQQFAKVGYRAIDAVRAAVWERDDVAPWYAQNTFVYAAEGVSLGIDPTVLPTRVVHPRMFTYRIGTPSLREVRGHLVPMAKDFVRWRLRRIRRRTGS
jgi:SAM-dependent methyltransferase